ncbi:MAG: DnaB-like helicase C-terminal domain-containing protein, partial [Clostridia bacterium]
IMIDDTANTSTTEMKAKLRRLKNLKLVIIDYLQLITCDRYSENKVLQVAEITRSLKLMAKEMKVPIVLCSQLARPPKNIKEKRPMLSDLRDSGAIEQDADIVMLLYREDYYDNAPEKVDKSDDSHEEIECIIAKNRHGATGTAKFAWHGQYFKFIPIEEQRNEPGR